MYLRSMRRSMMALLAVAVAAVIAGRANVARSQDVQATVTPLGGWTTWNQFVNLQRKPIFGIQAGALLRHRAGIEGMFGVVSSKTKAGTDPWFIPGVTTGPQVNMRQTQYGLDVMYNFLPTAFTPYATLGWRHFKFSSSDVSEMEASYNGYDAAVGAKWMLAPSVGIRGEMRDLAWRYKDNEQSGAPPNTDLLHNVAYVGGVEFNLGPKLATPAPPPPPPPVVVTVPSPPPPPDTVAVAVPVPVPSPPQHDTTVVVSEIERQLLDTGAITTRDIHFVTARWDILPQSYATLNDIGGTLSRWPALKIEIQGHCDSRGSDAYNMDLSQKRAASVLAYLVEHFPQIHASQYTAVGYGERVPVADNTSVEGMAMNRRVVFKVLNPGELSRERERLHVVPKPGGQ